MTIKIANSTIILLLFLGFNSLVFSKDFPAPLKTKRLQIKALDKAPEINGELGDAWKAATPFSDFKHYQGKKLTQKTDGFIGYFEGALYMAFICWENKMDSVIAAAKKNDSVIYGDDCIEIFMDTNNDLKTYYQFQVNSLGVYADKKCVLSDSGSVFKSAKWNAKGLKVAVKRSKDRWVAEIKLPLADLDVKWSSDLIIGANFTRAENPHRETSTWISVGTRFHNPKEFGRLWFNGGGFIDSARVVSESDGIVKIAAQASNAGEKPIDAAFVFKFSNPQVGEVKKEIKFKLPPKGIKEITFEYSSGYGGNKFITAELIDKKTGKKYDACQILLPTSGFNVSEEFKTPHTAWAKPTHGGKIKALFLLRYFNQRDVVELSQRIDLKHMSLIFIRHKWTYPERPTPREYLDKVRNALDQDLDVIIIGRDLEHKISPYKRGTALLDGGIQRQILEKVKKGTGLIIFAQKAIPKLWQGTLVNGCDKVSSRTGIPVVSEKKHFLTSGTPFDSFNILKLPVFDTENEVLATADKKPFLAVNQYGKGRVVVLGYDKNGMIPSAASSPSYRYWDYYFAFITKCLYWASGRNPEIEIDSIAVVPCEMDWSKAEDAAVSISMINKSSAGECEVHLSVRDKFSKAVFSESKKIRMKKEESSVLKFQLPKGLPDQGIHFAEIIIKKNGKVANWGIATFHVKTPLAISNIKPEKEYFDSPGDVFKARVSFSGKAATDDCRLKIKLVDRMGRVIGENSFPVKKQANYAEVQIPLHNPIWRSFVAEASLYQGKREMDKRVSGYVFYIPDRKLKEFGCFVWNWKYLEKHPDYTHDYIRRRLLECGFNGIEGRSRSLDMQVLTGLPFLANKHNHKVAERVAKQLMDYNRTGDSKFLVRNPCLTNSEGKELKKVLKKQRKIVENVYKQRPVLYHIGDENTLTHEAKPIDFCFAPQCLSEFRTWLKNKYATLDALNCEWSSSFKSWNDVLPMTKEQALKCGNYASWCDHRHFMQDVFTGAYVRQIKALRQVDPGALVGACGTRPMGAYTGIDWHKQLKVFSGMLPYSMLRNQAEVHRSFSDCFKMMATGLLKSKRQNYLNWKAALNGCSGLIFSKVSYAVTPDLAISDKGIYGKKFINELTAGVGQILLNSKRDQGKIGIYYSPSSAFVSWINEFRLGRSQVWGGPFHRSRAGWLKLIQDIGLQCRFVHPEQVKEGFLEKNGMKVLILPYSLAMGDDEIAQVKRFAKNGGFVIADYLPSVADWHGKMRKAGGLDDLLGVSGCMMKNDFVSGKVILENVKDKSLKGKTITSVLSGPEFKLNGGEALAEFVPSSFSGLKSFPAVVRKKTGSGVAYYLNFLYDYHCNHIDPVSQPIDRNLRALVKDIFLDAGLRPPLKISADGVEQSYTEVVPYESGKIKYYFILKDYIFPSEQEHLIKENVAIEFPQKSYIYNVRDRQFMGFKKLVKTNLKAGEATVFAMFPYKVEGMTVKGPLEVGTGDVAKFEFKIIVSDGAPGNQIARAEVVDPSGIALPYYCGNIVTKSGVGEFCIPLALNAARGKWRIKLTDIVSGKSASKEFNVK